MTGLLGAPEGAPLETYANNSSLERETALNDLRRRRYDRRGLLWRESGLERCRKCGRTRYAENVAVRSSGPGSAGYAGVISCGSVWVCPVCNAKVMARRALEIGAAVALWQDQGGAVVFGTFTMRHDRSQGLAALWDALAKAWAAATSGYGWQKDAERYGVEGWLRVVEVTWGRNGWHVHVHTLLFVASGSLTVENLHARMLGRWSRSLVKQGLAAPLAVGQDMRLVSGPAEALSAYFAKAVDRPGVGAGASAKRGTAGAPPGIGLEIVYSQGKTARSAYGTRTTWALLDDVEELGDAEALGMWHEWERGSKGRKQLTWSQGLRKRLHLVAEQSDEEVAAEEIGSAADDLVHITAAGWEVLCRVPADLARLLSAVERDGLAGAREFLDARGVEYVVVG